MDWRVSFFEARMGTNWHECHAELYKWGVSNAMRRIYLTGTDARLVRPHQWDFPANTHSRLRLHLGRTSRASVPAKRYTNRHLTLLRDAIIWRLYVPLRPARLLLTTHYSLICSYIPKTCGANSVYFCAVCNDFWQKNIFFSRKGAKFRQASAWFCVVCVQYFWQKYKRT